MLQKVRKGEELNGARLKDFLLTNDLINNGDAEIHITQFSNGYSNLTYLIEIEGKEFVLRKPPLGAIKRGHDMGREFKVLSQLSKSFPRAPKTFAFE